MDEFGIFNDEGCVESGFHSLDEAQAAIQSRYSPDDMLHSARVCHDHENSEAEHCEECAADEEDAS